MAYCTVQDVKQFIGGDEIDLMRISRLLSAVIESIENHYRKFVPVTATRVFDYKDTRTVKLDEDLVSVTEITTTANQTFSASDCVLEPRGGPPYRWIRLKLGKTFSYSGESYDAISVTGSWGYASGVPESVNHAIKTWVTILYNQQDLLGFESVEGGEISATLKKMTAEVPDEVKVWMEPYRPIRILSAGAA